MKKEDKKVNATKAAKKESKIKEQNGEKLTDELMSDVTGGTGVATMDGAVLVVASKDAPMPQTREHVLI
ncbi:MAG: hypothetical protein KBS59_00835 [Clostridiales bacterium]|nr:hypothetical protein [Clostridiales bacterium]